MKFTAIQSPNKEGKKNLNGECNKVYFEFVSSGNQEHAIERKQIINYFLKNNYIIVKNIKNANVIICDTCLFYYEDSILAVNSLNKNKNTKFIVTGPLSARKDLIKNRKGIIFLLYDELYKLDDILRVKNNFATIDELVLNGDGAYTIFISRGCFQECKFCVDKYGYGKLRSFSIGKIMDLFKKGLNRNFKNFYLLGHNTSIYGWDIGTNLALLLKNIIGIEKKYFVDIGNLNPEFLVYFKELKPILRSGKINSMTIPLISASNKIILLSGKRFKIDDFKVFLNWMQDYCPNIRLYIGLIIGYPHETISDFQETLNFVFKYLRADLIFRIYSYKDIYFSESYRLKNKVKEKEITRRVDILRETVRLSFNQSLAKNIVKVL